MKKEYFECDCGSFCCLIRLSYFPDDRDYIYLETHMPRFGAFKRIWQAVKYIFGFYTPSGETCLGPKTIGRMRDSYNEFLNYDFIPQGLPRELYNWMYKYDPSLAGKSQDIVAALLNKGAEQLYKEGLENAEPLPQEIHDALVELQARALEEALKEK